MKVCAGCGSVAPHPELPCALCAERGSVDAPDASGRQFYVAVRCQFQCRGCGRLAPADDVDVDGVIRCAMCGLSQAFDATVWRDAVAVAHGLGDLAGGEGLHPHPRYSIAATNPHRDVGAERAVVTTTVSGARMEHGIEVRRSLRMVAAPGHPLCGRCEVPLTVEVPSRGRAVTRCPRCAATREYAVSGEVLATGVGLVAVLADGHRADVRDAKPTSSGAVLGLNCAGCGGPLPAEGHARTVTCRFCQLVCRIPGEFELSADDAPPTPFWLVFSGPSQARRRLEHDPAFGDGEGARAVQRVAAGDVVQPGFFFGRLVPATVALGVTGVIGLGLFLLMRAGILRL